MQVPELNRYNQMMDPSGYYVLIKVQFDNSQIGIQICSANHLEEETFYGKQCQDIYIAILTHSKAREWFQDFTHIAYLGKELKKAEIALALGTTYYQE